MSESVKLVVGEDDVKRGLAQLPQEGIALQLAASLRTHLLNLLLARLRRRPFTGPCPPTSASALAADVRPSPKTQSFIRSTHKLGVRPNWPFTKYQHTVKNRSRFPLLPKT